MDADLLKTLSEYGLGGLLSVGGFYIFYTLIVRQQKEHREDRKHDSQMWREEIKRGRETSEKVVQQLSDVIRGINSDK